MYLIIYLSIYVSNYLCIYVDLNDSIDPDITVAIGTASVLD
jgi:hypothetical protein